MADEMTLYYAVLIGDPDLPTLPACFITASSDPDALTMARRRLGARASFNLWKNGLLVLCHQPL